MLAVTIAILLFGLNRLCGVSLPCLPTKRAIVRAKYRFKDPIPCLFLLIALVSLVGGLIHPPNNYDAMNFRLPKVLAWLMNGGWQWIPANNQSLNTRSAGMEWVFAPLFAWTGSDRVLFLCNQLPYFLMPGLVFGVFRRLGVQNRTSRIWMYVLPTGYGFALQAGGIGNDLPAAIFALAAFDFALRWKKTGFLGHALLALFAAGMMTAVKPTTLPLILPFTLLFPKMFQLIVRAPTKVAIATIPLALASFLPTAWLNNRQCGDWTGASAENASLGNVDPWIGIAGNLINAALQNLVPPVFPQANVCNETVIQCFPDSFLQQMAQNFEARGARFGVTDIQGEETAGLGSGIMMLLILGLIFGRQGFSDNKWHIKAGFLGMIFGIALLAYFSKAGMTTVARHILPYYPFLVLPILLIPRIASAARQSWFQRTAMIAMASTLIMLLITPSRPVLPMAMITRILSKVQPLPAIKRLEVGYEVYGHRANLLQALSAKIPAASNRIGYINHGSGPETSLWKPYGERIVCHLPPGSDPDDAWAGPVQFVVINTRNFEQFRGESPQQWLVRLEGTILLRQDIRPLVKEPPSEWWVVWVPKRAEN